jgi:hypothetical protein
LRAFLKDLHCICWHCVDYCSNAYAKQHLRLRNKCPNYLHMFFSYRIILSFSWHANNTYFDVRDLKKLVRSALKNQRDKFSTVEHEFWGRLHRISFDRGSPVWSGWVLKSCWFRFTSQCKYSNNLLNFGGCSFLFKIKLKI